MQSNKERATQLRKIEGAVRLADSQRLPLGPAAVRGMIGGIGAFIGVQLVSTYVISLPGWMIVAAVFVVATTITLLSPYKSYTAMIYDLLTAYSPLDVAAYKSLQTHTAKHGLRRAALFDWIRTERDAIFKPDHRHNPQQRFVDKQVGLHAVKK